MQTFKEYLITENEFSEKNDVSMNNDEELVDWVMNDEGLYNIARSAGSFEELMDAIDSTFTYNNDQYNTLARAFRRGQLSDEEEEESNVSPKKAKEMWDKLNRDWRDRDMERHKKRDGWSSGNIKTKSEEEEAKAPANRDRDMEFQGTMNRLNKPTQKDDLASTPGNKRLKQRYNRYKRKTWGGRT